MPKVDLNEKIAIITGASSGIGRATAIELARHGVHTVLASRNTLALQYVADQVKNIGREALVVPTDVTQVDQIHHLVQITLSRWGKVDILVSNAGQYIRQPITELTLDIVDRSMRVNFYAGLALTLSILPHMLTAKSGHIVYVTTMDAKTPIKPDAPYVAAKCALSGVSEVLRQELHGSGVFISTIYPGRVDSPMIEHLRFHWISAKISSESVARAIVKAIRNRRAEVIIPSQAYLLYLFRFLSPALSDLAVRLFHLEGWEKPSSIPPSYD